MQCSGKSMALTWALSEPMHENSYLSVQREGGRAHCTLNSTQLCGVFVYQVVVAGLILVWIDIELYVLEDSS